jgi:hypothetical protein
MNAVSTSRGAVILVAAILLTALAASPGLAVVMTYDFEALNAGYGIPLAGQDNWVWTAYESGAWVMVDTGVDGTQVASYGYNSRMSRTNDSSWKFPQYSGDETDAVAQFDMLYGVRPVHGLGGAVFIPGGNGPWFGMAGVGSGDTLLYIREAGGGPEHGVDPTGMVDRGDWVRLKMNMDFTGGGTGSLSYQNLTKGETSFTPVPGLQSVPLGLAHDGSSRDPAAWNSMDFILYGHGFDYNEVAVDNLVPNALELRPPSPYQKSVLADNPAAYWRLNERAVNNGPFDEVVLGVRGSFGGGETFGRPGALVNEPDNTGIGYNGVAGTFSTGNTLGQALFGGQDQVTVEFWIRPNADQVWSGLILAEYGISDFSLESNSLNPNWYIDNTLMGQVPLTEDEFQHVALVFDGAAGEARAYVNGELVLLKDSGVPASLNNVLQPFALGQRPGWSYAVPNVDFDELAIYQTALTADQIAAHLFGAIVPEPSSWLLLAVGALGLLVGRRRRTFRV